MTKNYNEKSYAQAVKFKESAQTLEDYQGVIDCFIKLVPYKNSIALLDEVYSDAWNEQIYQRAIKLRGEAETEQDFRELAETFAKIADYKDARFCAIQAREMADEIVKRERARIARKRMIKLLIVLVIIVAIISGIMLRRYLIRRAELERARIAQEQSRGIRETAMRAFFEGDAQASTKIRDVSSKSNDPVFLDMQRIMNYNRDGVTYIATQEWNSQYGSQSIYIQEALPLAETYISQGSINAAIFLGDMYATGLTGIRNNQKALEYYSQPVEAENLYALTAAAEINETLHNYDKATELYNKAASLGDKKAAKASKKAQDTAKYVKSADSGDPEAQYQAGLAYKKSSDNADLQRAFDLISKSANQEYAQAQFTLGEMYEKGDFVRQDYDQAIKWYEKAASHNILQANTCLGDIYYNVKRDYVKAREYFVAPAKKGDPKAEYYIGLMFERGQVTTMSYGQAIEWYNKAAEQGYEDATIALRRIESQRAQSQRSICGNKVFIRSYHNTDSSIIARLDEGTPLELIREENGEGGKWCYVKLDSGTTGWVFGDYVQGRLGTKGPHGGEYRSISADDVNLRSGPGRSYSSLGKLYEGHLVELLEQYSQSGETWYRIYTVKGQEGWVLRRYVRQRRKF